MVANGTMDKMEKSLARSAQDEMHAMVMPSYMKVFGMLSRQQEEDCLDKYPEFASLLFDLLGSSACRELRSKALETIAFICGSQMLAQRRATLKLILDQNETRNLFNENILKR